MYCKKCGSQIDDDSMFCKKCGENQLQKTYKDSTYSYPDKDVKKSSSPFFRKFFRTTASKIIAGVLAVAILTTGIVIIVDNHKKNNLLNELITDSQSDVCCTYWEAVKLYNEDDLREQFYRYNYPYGYNDCKPLILSSLIFVETKAGVKMLYDDSGEPFSNVLMNNSMTLSEFVSQASEFINETTEENIFHQVNVINNEKFEIIRSQSEGRFSLIISFEMFEEDGEMYLKIYNAKSIQDGVEADESEWTEPPRFTGAVFKKMKG